MNGNLSKCRLEVKDFDTSCVGHLGAVRRFGEIVPPNRLGIRDTPVKLMDLSVVIEGFLYPFSTTWVPREG